MPFVPGTPESLIGRSDSKNPQTTCRGITASGRPCRRALAASPNASPSASKSRVSQLRADDPSDPNLYCWQHQDQASRSARSSPGPRQSNTPILEARQSLESLFDRLDIAEPNYTPSKKPGRGDRRHERISSHGSPSAAAQPPRRKAKKKEKTFCLCFKLAVVEEERPIRPKPKPIQPATAAPMTSRPPSGQHLAPSPGRPRPSLGGNSPSKHSSNHSTTSQTSQYLSLIPPTASPQTASQLMAELAKPISQQDEAGYIYIFWLTPESEAATPPVEAARSLLAPPSRPDVGGGRGRRPSDVLESFAAKTGGSSKKTILLKIGRASNVQRRMNEWQRQCGYDLALIRYYPYISANVPSTPRKMPHSHKVERLIHLELSGAGFRVSDKANCEMCGRAHREWFEVEANRKAISMVDDVVRRWSDWDESQG